MRKERNMLTNLLIEKIKTADLKLISDLSKLKEIYVTEKILVKDKYGVLNTSVRNIITRKNRSNLLKI